MGGCGRKNCFGIIQGSNPSLWKHLFQIEATYEIHIHIYEYLVFFDRSLPWVLLPSHIFFFKWIFKFFESKWVLSLPGHLRRSSGFLRHRIRCADIREYSFLQWGQVSQFHIVSKWIFEQYRSVHYVFPDLLGTLY